MEADGPMDAAGPVLTQEAISALTHAVAAFSEHFKLQGTDTDIASVLRITQSAALGFREEYSAAVVTAVLDQVVRSAPPTPLVDTELSKRLPLAHHNVRHRLLRCLLRCNVRKLDEADRILSGLACDGFSEVDLFAALNAKYQHVHDPYLRHQFHIAVVHCELRDWITGVFGGAGLDPSWGGTRDFMDGLRDGVVLCNLLKAINPQRTASLRPVSGGVNAFVARDNVEQFLRFCRDELEGTPVNLFDIDELVMGTNDLRVVTTLQWLAADTMPMLRDPTPEHTAAVHHLVARAVVALPAQSPLSVTPSSDASCDFIVAHPGQRPGALVVPVRLLQHYLVAHHSGGYDELGYFLSRRVYEWDAIAWRYVSKRHRGSPGVVAPLSPTEVQILPATPTDGGLLPLPPPVGGMATMGSWTTADSAGVFLLTPTQSLSGPAAPSVDIEVSSSLLVRVHNGADGVLGRGAYGTVYRALNLRTSALLAVKVVRTDHLNTQARANLTREISVLQRLHHGHIVRYFGQTETPQEVAIVMGYAAGGSLATVLGMFGVLPEGIVRQYAQQTLLGLQYLHSYDVVHRDIKPGNVLLHHDGRVALADFGCCKHIAEVASLRGDGSGVVGTPAYMAPEVVTREQYTPACDIWALGCCILEVATGARAWHHLALGAIPLLCHIGRSGETPVVPPTLSERLQDFLRRCFAVDPALRPSAATLLEHVFVKTVIP